MINTDKRTRAYKDEKAKLERDSEIVRIDCAREQCKTKDDILSHVRRYPSWRVSDEDKMLLANSMIPEGAKQLYNNDLNEYRGFLIAGWLKDSQCIVYGLCNRANNWTDSLQISGYSLSVSWEPTKEELSKLIKGYPHD